MSNFFFNPDILGMKKFQLEMAPTDKHTRIIKDYELDFYVSGNRTMTVNNKKNSVGCNSVVFRKPGDCAISTGSYNCYALTLDFSHKKVCHTSYKDDPREDKNSSFQELSDNPLLSQIPTHFVSPHPNEYIRLFDKLCYSYQGNDKQTNLLLLNQLFFIILSDICYLEEQKDTTDIDNTILSKTSHYIQENFGKPITIKDLAHNVALSESYFIKAFKSITNITPIDYLISIRLSNAKRYLAESTLSIVEISDICGFNDASYFSYYFKKKVGMTPSRYRTNKKLN